MPWPGHNNRPITATTRSGDRLVFWLAITIPAATIKGPGGAKDPDQEADTGTWLFASGATEELFIQYHLDHNWKEGTVIGAEVHWMKTTSASGNVLWSLDYKWMPVDEVMDSEWTNLQNDTVASRTTDTDTANKHLITTFSDIDTSNKVIEDMILFRIQRIGGDAADTYGADARLLEFDIITQIDRPGSYERTLKGTP